MQAIVWTRYGPPEGLELQEVPKPAPRDGEVLIRIHATTVTAADCQLRSLKIPLPFRLALRMYLGLSRTRNLILGQELAGEIEAVGQDVDRFKVGDQVTAWTGLGLGTYAEYTCMPAKGVLAKKPTTMTYEEAATLAVGGLEAVHFLKRGHIQSEQRVLINGAGGSIGTFAVQLAKHLGARVTAVDRPGKLEMLRSIGADQVVDYTQQDFTRARGGETYDVIFDVVGKSPLSRSLKSLAPGGRYLIDNAPLLRRIRGRWAAVMSGKHVIPWSDRAAGEYAEDFLFLKELIEAGKIHAVIDRRYSLAQIPEAHRYVETGDKKGSVVITVQHNEHT
jgi:NADPH:quinone reductase-like Zn-dependent oxidoreductase